MRSFGLFLLLFFIPVSAIFSQSWFAGGSVFFQNNSSSGSGSSEATSIGISPTLGYKINSKFDLGISPLFQHETNPGSSIDKVTTFGGGIFTRYSFLEIGKLSVLGRLGLNYFNSTYNISVTANSVFPPYKYTYSSKEKLQSIGVNIGPIFEYRLLDNLSLHTNIGSISYSHSWWNDGYSSDYFGLVFSTGISLGILVLF